MNINGTIHPRRRVTVREDGRWYLVGTRARTPRGLLDAAVRASCGEGCAVEFKVGCEWIVAYRGD